MPNSSLTSHPRRRGAPLGNTNALKHGFYARRLKYRNLSSAASIDLKSLVDEIALIRVFTRKLVESCHPSADLSELTGILRILCLASSTITRILRVHYLITGSEADLDRDIEEAMSHVQIGLTPDPSSSPLPAPAQGSGVVPSSQPPTPRGLN